MAFTAQNNRSVTAPPAIATCMPAGWPVMAWNGARWQANRYRRLSDISTCWRVSKSSTHLPVPSTTDSSGLSAR